ncbi:MAG: hypothetical protein H5T47_05575 [Archaeoglobi archaeon]|nr:hypothetical protein [Candidatus Mnemosynella bozhongmuii]
MKILHEFVPTRKFLNLAEETKNLVDGWNITDSASGIPAPSGTAVGCVLKTKYPEKTVLPVFILHYKSAVEAGALALAASAVGVDGLVVDGPMFRFKPYSERLEQLWGDKPAYGDALAQFKSPEEGRDFLREITKSNIKIGGLVTAKRPLEDCIAKARDSWDFIFFMRLEETSFSKLEEVAKVCRELGKQIYTYFLIETEKNRETLKKIGWSPTTTMDGVEEFAERLEGVVDGIIATCAGDAKGDLELLEKLQPFRS